MLDGSTQTGTYEDYSGTEGNMAYHVLKFLDGSGNLVDGYTVTTMDSTDSSGAAPVATLLLTLTKQQVGTISPVGDGVTLRLR
jgi:hypothetical protein